MSVLSYDEAAAAMQRIAGCSRQRAETMLRLLPEYRDIAPTPDEKDENVLEKAEQLEIRKLAIVYGFNVNNLSQARKSRIAFGIPDLYLVHTVLPIAIWWESKRQVGGRLSKKQAEFRDDMQRTNTRWGSGDRYAFVEKLIELELAVRGAGQYGIEPIHAEVVR